MKNLMILVKMQLKEQLNFKRLDIGNVGIFHIIASIVGAVLKFALVTALCIAFLLASKLLGIFSFANRPIPDTVISIVFSAMLLVSVFSCVISLTKSMFFSRDNAILLTFPTKPVEVYLSKLIIFFIFEVKRNMSFLVPLFIAYYALHGYGFFAYPWMLFCMLWVSLFTVAAGALLSIPAMWIGNFFRQKRSLQVAGIAAVVTVAIVAVFYGISLIPENIDLLATWNTTYWQIQDILTGYATNFRALYDVTLMVLGETEALVASFPFTSTMLRLLALIGVTLALLFAGLLIVKPLFYKMASKPFEYLKKQTKPKKNVRHSKHFSPYYNEFLVSVKSANRMLSNIGIAISVPLLIFLLNKIFLAMKTRELGDSMIIAFNILIILLILLNSNCYAASIFSRDGRSNYLIKTHPTKYLLVISAKLLPNAVFAMVSIVATFAVMLLTVSLPLIDIILLTLSIAATYLAHMLYCAELDLMNPQIELYATVGSSESNPNETKATISAFIVSFAVAAFSFLLMIDPTSSGMFVKFIIISLALLGYRTWLFLSKIKLYYKEK